jgi:hypothetical protein
MTVQHRFDPFSMVPQSLIMGELEPGMTTQTKAMLLLLYAYVDLRQGDQGRPVRGFRDVGKALGVQSRTVSCWADHLSDLGLMKVDRTDGPLRKASMSIIHNPARKRWNDLVAVEGPAVRSGHSAVAYLGESTSSRETQELPRDPRIGDVDPSACRAPGSRSTRSGRSDWPYEETSEALRATLSDDGRCVVCRGLTARSAGIKAEGDKFCTCPM